MIRIKKINEAIDSKVIYQYLSKEQLLQLFKEKISDEKYIEFLKENTIGNPINQTYEIMFLTEQSLETLSKLIKDYDLNLFNNILEEMSEIIF